MRTAMDGPVIIYGNDNPQQMSNTDAGPSVDYQGGAIIDPRFVASVAKAPTAGQIPAFYNAVYVPLVDGVPQTKAANAIAASQALTNGGAVTLVSTQGAAASPNIPLVPYGLAVNSANVVKVLALDFGFAIGATTATSTAVTLSAAASAKFFRPGQKIIISGAGATANNPLITTVVSVSGTALVIADAAGQTVAAAQIGTADSSGVTASPYQSAGAASLFDATQAIARTVTVTASGASSGTVTVSGYDIYGMPMTETITIVGTGTANGKKAFKYISGAVANGAGVTTGTHQIGTNDLFGMNLRTDFWEYANIFWAGAFVTTSTGWLTADTTSPATSTTGDVRGTYATQSAANGTNRLAIFVSLPQYNAVNATNLNPATLTGVTQA